MKEWWMNLALREKQMVGAGGIVIALFLIYEIIWAPFINKMDHIRKEIRNDQQLLVWMQASDQHIQALERILKKDHARSTASLLGIVQTQINNSNVGKGATQLKEADSDSVQVSFQSVSFDELVTWLNTLWQEQGLIVSQARVTPGNTPGIVSADIILKVG